MVSMANSGKVCRLALRLIEICPEDFKSLATREAAPSISSLLPVKGNVYEVCRNLHPVGRRRPR